MDIIKWLRDHDKALYGMNATYKKAAELAGVPRKQVMKHIYDAELKYWQRKEPKGTPKKATKEINLDWKDWENVQVFFRRFHNIIIEPGTTVEFIIRLMRSKRLPANEHIVNEMLQHRKITLKGVDADELS